MPKPDVPYLPETCLTRFVGATDKDGFIEIRIGTEVRHLSLEQWTYLISHPIVVRLPPAE